MTITSRISEKVVAMCLPKRWRARTRSDGIHHRQEKFPSRPVETVECSGVVLHSNNPFPGSLEERWMIRKIRLISDQKTMQTQGSVWTKSSAFLADQTHAA